MIRIILLSCCLLAGCFAVASEEGEVEAEVDETFGFETFRDVSYIPLAEGESPEARQTLDIYKREGGRYLPVIIYLHDGGWAFGDKKDVAIKPHFFTREGFGFISMNYRLRWDYKVYDQVADIVSVMKWLQTEGENFGLDGSRVILMGHQAGGHLASLVVTDQNYFKAEGLDLGRVRAVVSIDSASYDITRLMRELGSFLERRQHELIFGTDEEVWQAASPVSHIANNPDVPAFALLYNPENESAQLQAKGFAKLLVAEEVPTIMVPGSADQPDKTDELLGSKGNVATIALMAFLRSQL